MEDNSVKAPNSDVVAGRAKSGRRRAGRPRSVLAAAIGAAVLGLAACGGGSGGSSHAGGSTGSQSTLAQKVLSYSRCMRQHGVANFPDPNSSGALPKSQLAPLVQSPQFPPAQRECQHLLPNGGQPSQVELQQEWSQYRDFTRCMRNHGVSNFPDPTADPHHPERPIFNLPAAGIGANDPNVSQLRVKAQECQSQLHMSQLPSYS